jgi:hypothetical protein
MSELIGLYRLRVGRQAENLARDRVLYADSRDIRPPETHKQISALNPFHHPVGLQLVAFPQMPRSGVAEVGTRWMGYK